MHNQIHTRFFGYKHTSFFLNRSSYHNRSFFLNLSSYHNWSFFLNRSFFLNWNWISDHMLLLNRNQKFFNRNFFLNLEALCSSSASSRNCWLLFTSCDAVNNKQCAVEKLLFSRFPSLESDSDNLFCETSEGLERERDDIVFITFY